MCTAIHLKEQALFGRTLDLEHSFGESLCLMPRGFTLNLRCEPCLKTRFSVLGTAKVSEGFPLFFDAVNEKGLSMAGLNFPKSAKYYEQKEGALNLTSFELIPYILGQCENLREAPYYLDKLNILSTPFSKELPASPLHWMVADKEGAVVIESTDRGLNLYTNPIGVMTNEPPFHYHMTYLENFSNLSPFEKGSRYSRGLSAFGLPGDFSSSSRFVKGAYLVKNFPCDKALPTDLFRLLETLSVPKGAVILENGKEVITRYTACMDLNTATYYLKTYGNSRICAVNAKDFEGSKLIRFPQSTQEDLLFLKNTF